MAGTLTPTPFQTVLDDTGVAVSGALIYTYTAGTTTAAATYTTSALSVANANPIVADSAGRYVAYLAAGANMKFVYKTAAGATIRTQDNVLSVPGSAVNLDIQGTVGVAVTAGQVCYLSSGLESPALTPGLWYLADADFAVSSTTCQSIGMAVSAIPINTAGTIRLAGLATTASAVVVGSTYYVSATAGGITTSAPALARVVGVADTTSTLILAATSAIVASLPNPISQDLLFVDATYDIGKAGATRPRDMFSSRNTTIGNTLTVVGTSTLAAVGATTGTFSSTLGVTGVGTFTAAPVFSSTTASQAMFTDAGKALVSNPVTGTGNVVMSASPTLTGTIGAEALTLTTPLDVASGGSGRATATTAYAVLAAGTTATGVQQSIAPSTSGFVLTDNGVGVLPSFKAAAASGVWGLSASVATNILTVALTTAAGSTPSASTPVALSFRNVTAATGDMTTISVTAASTIAVPDTATLGTSNSVAFRAWIVAFNDAGTVRLGIINCAAALSIYPLSGFGIASATSISTGSDSAQVFYTGSTVTSKAYTVLGYVTYESGLATAGTYASAPTRVQVYTADVSLPCRPVQTVAATTTTQTASTSATYADTTLTATITPTSAANRVFVQSNNAGLYKDTSALAIGIKLFRGATEIAYAHTLNSGAVFATSGGIAFNVLDPPNSAAAIIYKTQFAAEAGVGTVYVQEGTGRSTIVLTELMA
jgi:hypothetical protein